MHLVLIHGRVLSSRILDAVSIIYILLASELLLERDALPSVLLLLLFFLPAHLGHPLQSALLSEVNQLPPAHDTDKRQEAHMKFCARTSQRSFATTKITHHTLANGSWTAAPPL